LIGAILWRKSLSSAYINFERLTAMREYTLARR
jgi:hypothetical protein